MSPRAKKTPEVAVEETQPSLEAADQATSSPEAVAAEQEQEQEQAAQDTDQQMREEFNEFIVSLARNAAQQEISALEARITDLEQLVAQKVLEPVHPSPDVPGRVLLCEAPQDDVPTYTPAHQESDGVGWYHG